MNERSTQKIEKFKDTGDSSSPFNEDILTVGTYDHALNSKTDFTDGYAQKRNKDCPDKHDVNDPVKHKTMGQIKDTEDASFPFDEDNLATGTADCALPKLFCLDKPEENDEVKRNTKNKRVSMRISRTMVLRLIKTT